MIFLNFKKLAKNLLLKCFWMYIERYWGVNATYFAIFFNLNFFDMDNEQKKTEDQKEILSSAEVMQILGISRNTFDRFRKEGIIRTYKLGRRVYCKYSELLEALEAQEASS